MSEIITDLDFSYLSNNVISLYNPGVDRYLKCGVDFAKNISHSQFLFGAVHF